MVLGREEGLVYWYVRSLWMGRDCFMCQFRYLRCVLDGVKYRRKVVRGRNVAGAINALVNARKLQLEYEMMLNKAFIMPVLL